jgi:hypothetical protein
MKKPILKPRKRRENGRRSQNATKTAVDEESRLCFLFGGK